MSAYDKIAEALQQPHPGFDAFFADMKKRIPALDGKEAIEIPVTGFKRALKAAYLAGEADQLARILEIPSDPAE